jgi:c-di-GMP-binding flagellar brake protein YcgR
VINAQTWSRDQSVLHEERRRHPRVQIPVQIEIRPASMDVPMRLETTDISLGGCYVEMALTLDVGTKLDIVLWLDGQKVNTRGVVVTRHPQFGNGIEFVGMFSESEHRLRCFLESHENSWQARTPPDRR